jgi:hypothetical protein
VRTRAARGSIYYGGREAEACQVQPGPGPGRHDSRAGHDMHYYLHAFASSSAVSCRACLTSQFPSTVSDEIDMIRNEVDSPSPACFMHVAFTCSSSIQQAVLPAPPAFLACLRQQDHSGVRTSLSLSLDRSTRFWQH